MFKACDEITAAVDAVAAIVRARKRGDLVGWPEIEAAAGFERGSPHWSAFVRRLKRRVLDEQGLTLWPVPGLGYRLQTHAEQLHDRAISRQRRASRQLTRDRQELEALPMGELSLHQQEVRRRMLDRTREARRGVVYALRVSHALRRPAEDMRPAKPGKAVIE